MLVDIIALDAINDVVSALVAVRLQEPILRRIDQVISTVRTRYGIRTTRQQIIHEALDRHLAELEENAKVRK
jgi:hypothetical protein